MSTLGIASAALGRSRFRYARETDLHAGLEQAFTDAGLAVRREVTLGVDGRIDFVLTHQISTSVLGVEVKVAGGPVTVARQLLRYAAHVDDLLLISTRAQHLTLRGMQIPTTTGRLHVHHLRGGGL